MADYQEQTTSTTKILKVGTWNIESLNNVKNLIEVAKTYDTDIIAVQDTRWPKNGTYSEDNYTFYYGGAKENQLGMGFLINNRISQAVLDVKFISDRLSYIVLKFRYYRHVYINVHGPSKMSSLEMKNEYYSTLNEVFDQFSSYDVKIVLGTFNAKIGKELIYRPIVGSESLHDLSNSNGRRVIEFAEMKDLVVKSTCLKHKDIHKATMVDPANGTLKQMSYVLVNRRYQTNVDDVRSYRGADLNSNHFLVIAKIKYEN